MKKTKFLNSTKIIVVAFVTLITGCTEENSIFDENQNLTLEEALNKDINGHLIVGNNTYVFNKNGVTSKFTAENLTYSFDYKNLNYEISGVNKRASDTNYVIVNPDTNEYIVLENLNQENNSYTFDVITSSGMNLIGVNVLLPDQSDIYSESIYGRACPWCWIGVVIDRIVEAIVDINTDNFDSNCRAAISACGDAGVAEITIIDGWFEDSCTVKCNKPE